MPVRDMLFSAAGLSGKPAFFVIDNTKTLYYSADGSSWTNRGAVTITGTPTQMAYANGYLVLVDNVLHSRQSSNLGVSFSTQTTFSGGVYTYQMAVDPTGQYFVIGTDYGVVGYSTDYGVSFTGFTTNSQNIFSTVYANGYFLYGTAGGSFTRALATSPGTSSAIGSTTQTTYFGCWDPSTNTVYVMPAGYSGSKLASYSTNNGANWTTFPPPILNNWNYGTAVYNGKLIYADSTNAFVYVTTDTGASWTSVATTGTPTSICQLNGTFLLTTTSGVFTSTNGTTWTSVLSGNFLTSAAGQ